MAVVRGQAEQGSTVRLRMYFLQDNQTPFDPYAIEKVDILDADGAIMVTYTFAASQIIQESTGVWYVDWPVPVAQAIGLYHDRWYWTALEGGTQRTVTGDFYVHSLGTFGSVTTYMTITEARERLDADVSASLSDAQVLLLLWWAQEVAEQEGGHSWLPQVETVTLDGTGLPVIILPKRLRQLTSLTIDGDAVDVTALNVYPTKIVWGEWVPGEDTACADTCGGCSTESVFPHGRRNVAIEGLWGQYGAVPRNVNEGIKLLIARFAEEPMPFEPFAEETLPDWSAVRRRVVEAPDVRDSTGWTEIQAMFALFKKRHGKVSVI